MFIAFLFYIPLLTERTELEAWVYKHVAPSEQERRSHDDDFYRVKPLEL